MTEVPKPSGRDRSTEEPRWHALGAEAVLAELGTNSAAGLSQSDVSSRRAEHGDNSLPRAAGPGTLAQLLAQLKDPLVGALLAAAIVAAAVASSEGGDEPLWLRYSDTFAILLIVIVNAAFGFFQERKAEAALAALEDLAAPLARVRREGQVLEIAAEELVPGDVVVLETGDAVPADLRLFETRDLATVEASLTGEAAPIAKDGARILASDAPLADQTNKAFWGTSVARGRALGVVVATGATTELGKIGALLGASERPPTPLEEHLARFGKIILVVCLAASALLFGLGMFQGHQAWPALLLTAVSLAVAAIPEGLPAITTITLGLGMLRMAERGAIVRKLPAVETLGSATVICSDKTGTLTQNAMVVRRVLVDGIDVDVSGTGYETNGSLSVPGAEGEELPDVVDRLLRASALCNTAHVREVDGRPQVLGDPTEAALLVLAAKGDAVRERLLEQWRITDELPFSSERKRMSIVAEAPDGAPKAFVKGSPDVLLPRCVTVATADGDEALDEAGRAVWLGRNDELAGQAMRVLAIAERASPTGEVEEELTLLGLVAMLDPPRPEARDAVAQSQAAGIRVIMITGDHRLTAEAIGRELGIWRDGGRSLTGTDVRALDDEALAAASHDVSVYARTTAEQKLRIVNALTAEGEIVAMTGDGVNDAPALKRAAIGVAMGKSGTDVARQASDMVLGNDDFATIVAAVREGRAIFRNIQKFVFFLNSSNAGLVVAVIVASFFSWMPPLLPIQLLWINLVTNGLPALALGVDPPQAGQMQERPRPIGEGVMNMRDALGILLVGVVMGGLALSLFMLPEHVPELFEGLEREAALDQARTMAFTLLALSPLFHAHSCRSPRASVFTLGWFSNRWLWGAITASALIHMTTFLPALAPVFRTQPMSAAQWGVVLLVAAAPLPMVEVLKAAERRLAPRAGS